MTWRKCETNLKFELNDQNYRYIQVDLYPCGATGICPSRFAFHPTVQCGIIAVFKRSQFIIGITSSLFQPFFSLSYLEFLSEWKIQMTHCTFLLLIRGTMNPIYSICLCHYNVIYCRHLLPEVSLSTTRLQTTK